MSKSRIRIATVLSALALAALDLAVTVPARATVMVEVSLDDMVRGADAIVRGTITRTGVRMQIEDGHMEPYSVSEVAVDEWLSGPGDDHVTVRERGGEWQGAGHFIDGTPHYRVGEEVILFLERNPSGRDFCTYAMAQGKFIVRRGVPGTPGQVRRDLEGMSFAHWEGDGMELRGTDGEPAMALDTFLARIHAVLQTYGDAAGTDALGGGR